MHESMWKSVTDYPHYMINEYGELMRLPCKNISIVRISKGSKTSKGYRQFKLYSLDGHKKSIKAHTLVAKAFLGVSKNKPQVNHKDGNKLNNHYLNLEWVTNSENMAHAIKEGLVDNRGEKSGKAKLKEKTVIEIITTKGTITNREWTERLGSPRGYIASLRAGRRWHHIWEKYNA